MEQNRGLCVSIFMPAYRGGPESQQNSIRFKNLLREAKERLQVNGLRELEAEKLLDPAQEFLMNSSFWKNQSDGLAVFISSDMFRYYRLPFSFDELVVVTDHFDIKPLLPLLTRNGQFYVLALSQNEVRLLQGSQYNVSEIELKELPNSLAEALRYDEYEKEMQLHTGTEGTRETGPRTDRAAIFHGHGVEKDEFKEKIQRYFQQINKGLHEFLREKKAPLVLAGVEYLFPLYEEANTYPHLIDEGITGNPEELTAKELHEKAWDIIKPIFLSEQEEAIAQYKQASHTEKASNDISEVVQAAYYGRVDLLLVAVGVQKWGTFDPDANEVHLHEEEKADDDDLLDFAAIHTLLNGGDVYAVEPDEAPDDSVLAALFRY